MPRTAASNWAMTSGFSGLPKFRQSVIASGRAPTAATERAASATAIAPPRYGSAAQKNGLTSLFIATPFFVTLTRVTAASPAGRTTELLCIMWSLCDPMQDFTGTFGDAMWWREVTRFGRAGPVLPARHPRGRAHRPGLVVDGGAVRELRGRKIGDDAAFEEEDDAAGVGDPADLDGVELPLVEDRQDFGEPIALADK